MVTAPESLLRKRFILPKIMYPAARAGLFLTYC